MGASAQLVSQSQSTSVDAPKQESEQETVFYTLQYQANDLDWLKESGSYGFGAMFTSFANWGRFHVGCNFQMGFNFGLVDSDYSAFVLDFGPSLRFDISDNVFINMPVDATYTKVTRGAWGMRISPSLHYRFSRAIGIYLGPQFNRGFNDGGESNIGAQVGLTIVF